MFKFIKSFLFSNIVNTYPIDFGLLFLRVSFGGVMFIQHGLSKLMNYSQMSAQFYDPFGIGGSASFALVVLAEFFAAIAVFFGLLTRLAVIPLIINMSVAFFFFHKADPFKTKELALMFLIPWVVILITGPGRFSLDFLLAKLFHSTSVKKQA